MVKRIDDEGRWAALSPAERHQWGVEFRERRRYLALDGAVAITLLLYQAKPPSEAEPAVLLAGILACLTLLDLVLLWTRLDVRSLTVLTYLCALALIVSVFFSDIAVLWAIVDVVVFGFWIGMFTALTDTVRARATGEGPTDPTAR